MKFLIYGNAPHGPTGYAVQIGHLAVRLKREGHDVAVLCNWGHSIGVVNWPTPYGPVRLYPQGVLEQSVDMLNATADHFFDGDRRAGWIIPLNDLWGINTRMIDWQDFNVLAWCPVDHWPVPKGVLEFFHNSGARPVAMSRFGEKMLTEGGLDPLYAPLAVDTSVYRPTFTVNTDDGPRDARSLFEIPQDAFVVLMVAMNKDPQDRKNFDGAFRGFARFWKDHKNAVLVVHTDPTGMYGGINLQALAVHAAVPPHALIFTHPLAQRWALTPDKMAGLYTAADVLLAPSKGEGFCVPMIEAQACGTPVIASDFTAQSELIGAGWGLTGQLAWDPHQTASYLQVFHQDIYDKLCEAYESDLPDLSVKAVEFAQRYDADRVFDDYWKPILKTLEPPAPVVKPRMERVDVIVPCLRERNRSRLLESFDKTATSDVTLFVGEDTDEPSRTYAENVNEAWKRTTADWVLVVGDDCEFTPGWLDALRELSTSCDVIGTNDSEPGRVRNPDVAAGRHADHFAVRRSYIDDEGATLDGPGILTSEAYQHWYTDKEIVELAKARGVYGHAHDCRIIHHHPGYDGDEAAREADPVYMRAVEHAERDRRTFMSRLPLIVALKAA